MTEQLRIELTANTSQFTAQMDSALAKVKRMGDQMRDVGKKMSVAVTLPLLGAGTAAVNSAVKFEKLQTSLEVLTGSVEAGEKAFKRLRDFSASTPFQLGDLVSVNNQLLGFGMNADDAFNSLKMLGDVAAVSGADLSRVAVAFGQSAAAGRVMTQDLNQFINNGIPIYQILGDVTGKNVGELRDLASQGGVTFEMLQAGFKAATSEGGTFFEGTKRLSQTLGGQLSTLKDNFDLMLGSFGEVIGNGLRPLISAVQSGAQYFMAMSDETKVLVVQLAAVAASVGPLLFLAGTVLPAMATGFAVLTSPITLVVAGIAALAAGILYVSQNWNAIVERISDIGWWRNALLEMIIQLTKLNPFDAFLTAYNTLANKLGATTIPNPFDGSREYLESLKVETKEYANSFGTFADAVKSGAKKALDALIPLGNKQAEIASNASSGASATVAAGGLGGGSSSLGGGPEIADESALEAQRDQLELIGLSEDEMARFGQRANEAYRAIEKFGSDSPEHILKLREQIDLMNQNIQRGVNLIGQGMTNAFQNMMNGTEDPFQAFMDMIKQMITRLIAAAVAAFVLSTIIQSIFPTGGLGGGMDFQSLFSSFSGGFALPEFASGGIISGPTIGLMGEYSGARTNPEVVAPLNKLQGMLDNGGGQPGRLVSKISGADILLVQEREQSRRTRRRGN